MAETGMCFVPGLLSVCSPYTILDWKSLVLSREIHLENKMNPQRS